MTRLELISSPEYVQTQFEIAAVYNKAVKSFIEDVMPRMLALQKELVEFIPKQTDEGKQKEAILSLITFEDGVKEGIKIADKRLRKKIKAKTKSLKSVNYPYDLEKVDFAIEVLEQLLKTK